MKAKMKKSSVKQGWKGHYPLWRILASCKFLILHPSECSSFSSFLNQISVWKPHNLWVSKIHWIRLFPICLSVHFKLLRNYKVLCRWIFDRQYVLVAFNNLFIWNWSEMRGQAFIWYNRRFFQWNCKMSVQPCFFNEFEESLSFDRATNHAGIKSVFSPRHCFSFPQQSLCYQWLRFPRYRGWSPILQVGYFPKYPHRAHNPTTRQVCVRKGGILVFIQPARGDYRLLLGWSPTIGWNI